MCELPSFLPYLNMHEQSESIWLVKLNSIQPKFENLNDEGQAGRMFRGYCQPALFPTRDNARLRIGRAHNVHAKLKQLNSNGDRKEFRSVSNREHAGVIIEHNMNDSNQSTLRTNLHSWPRLRVKNALSVLSFSLIPKQLRLC